MGINSSESTHELLLAETSLDVENEENLPTFRRFIAPFERSLEGSLPTRYKFTVELDQGSYILNSDSGDDAVFQAPSEGDFLLKFDRFLIDKFLSWVPDSALLVHAAGFLKGSTVMVFPGGSGSGKTSLSEYLLTKTDWTFLTDEILALDPDEGMVYPFPHPLNVNQPPSTSRVRSLEVQDSAGNQFFYGLPFPDRSRNRSVPFETLSVFELDRTDSIPTGLETLSPGEGLQRLMQHALKPDSTRVRFDRAAALETFDLEVHRLRYHDLSDVNFDWLKSESV